MEALQFIQIDPVKFKNEIINAILEGVSRAPDGEEVFNRPQACKFLSLSRNTFIRLEGEGLIKSYQIGDSQNRYKKSDLIESLTLIKTKTK